MIANFMILANQALYAYELVRTGMGCAIEIALLSLRQGTHLYRHPLCSESPTNNRKNVEIVSLGKPFLRVRTGSQFR
jgi:hypothetical protein